MRKSPAHFRSGEEQQRESTDAMRLGELIHAAILEGPDAVGRRFAVEPDASDIRRQDGQPAANPKSTSQWKRLYSDFLDSIGDRAPIPAAWLEISTLVRRNALDHSLLRKILLSDTKQCEVSIVGKALSIGHLCKCRVDLLDVERRLVLDLKTTSHPLANISRLIADRQYHVSAAFYVALCHRVIGHPFKFYFAFAETRPPFSVVCAPLSDESLAEGMRVSLNYMRTYSECLDRDTWPGPVSPDEFSLPGWAFSEV